MREAFIFLGPECNFRCKFCYSSLKMRHLDTGMARSEIDKYLKAGYNRISFTGGEPTVRADLLELIAYAKSRGATSVKIQTNGLLTSDLEYLKNLESNGLDAVYVSIHSFSAEKHDYLVGKEGSFIKAVKTIENCSNLNLLTELGFVITKMNYRDMLPFLQFINKKCLKIDSIQFLFECPSEGALDYQDMIPKLSEIELELYNALDYGLNNKIKVFTRGIPLCYLPDHKECSVEYLSLYNTQGAMVESLTGKTEPKHSFEDTNCKVNVCSICHLNAVCGGPWKAYIKLFGDKEFYPIFDKNSLSENKETIKKQIRNYFN